MKSQIVRVLSAALVGAIVGAVSLGVAFSRHPDLTFEMDRDLPRTTSGFYPIERFNRETFVWTSARGEIVLPGFDRSRAWRCGVRARGARPGGVPLPAVTLEVDRVALIKRAVANDYEEIAVTVPPKPSLGLRLGISATPTFVPPGDPRELGVQVDWVTCRPEGGGLVFPPRGAILAAAASAAVLGAAFALAGVAMPLVIALTIFTGFAQSFPLSTGLSPYLDHGGRVVSLAAWIGIFAVALVFVIERVRPRFDRVRGTQPLHTLARFVIAFSALALYLKLIGLLHPSKPIADALFHAHRLEWVLAGRYFFTQQMPDGVQFPYAIALYVFAAPWTLLTRDYISLLRIVVCAAEAVAGALLYLMVVRSWGDRVIGALAVVLFHLVPLPYVVLGNANLTNAFGAAVSLVTMAAATIWPLGPGQIAQAVALTALATVGLLSHVSIFGLLSATLIATAFFYRALGGRPLRRPARVVFLATVIAAVVSVAGYYAHFGDAYRSLERTGDDAVSRPAAPAAGQAEGPAVRTPPASPQSGARPWYRRTLIALDQGVFDLGWPLVILAIVGAWRVWKDRLRGPLTWVICAWGAAYLAFLAVSVMAPVDVGYERYAAEFIGRVDLSTYPADVLLAACGAVWLWRAGFATRLASAALLIGAVIFASRYWMGWIR
ncbi:MAG TPA: hypothetical protein VF424_08125 [Vicinamibacterales bacterium]